MGLDIAKPSNLAYDAQLNGLTSSPQHQATAVERVEWVLSWKIILINDILYCYDYYLCYEMFVNIYLRF